jgi:hypothetical protein
VGGDGMRWLGPVLSWGEDENEERGRNAEVR